MNVISVFMCAIALATTSYAADPSAPPKAGIAERDSALSDLPLNVITADSNGGDCLAVFLSGDGGWSSFDNGISQRLAKSGVPVVGWNSLKYFWSKRTPDGAAVDLARILKRYMDRWRKKRAVVVGYSYGADVLPFMVNRLPDDLRVAVVSVALISPSHYADFEFHVTTWLGKSSSKSSLPVVPEVLGLKGKRILIFYGTDEEDTITADLPVNLARIVALKGGHHMGRDYDRLASQILMGIP